jgi:anaerobic dimethyl sulfoxide reductase subunit A
MYIPILEGGHADGSHPDPSGAHANGYTLQLMASHLRYRSHSTHNNNAYLNEFYKGDGTKNASPYNDQSAGAFLDPGRAGHGNPNRFNSVWDDKVYEPVWINPADANKLGISDGNRVLISNDRGKVYAIAQVTNRAHPGVVCLGQGGWYNGTGDKSAIDVGGCANTLTKRRPSRICQGMTLGSDTLVRIELAQLG